MYLQNGDNIYHAGLLRGLEMMQAIHLAVSSCYCRYYHYFS